MENYADQTFRSSSFPTESLSSPGESVSRFRAGCIHIKMTYFDKEYAKVFVALIGLFLVSAQQNTFWYEIEDVEFGSHHRLTLSFSAATLSVLSGVLSYMYPAQIILLVSIFLTSMFHMVNQLFVDVFKEQMDSIFFIYLGRHMMFVTALPAFHGIWASLIQLRKSSVLHLPIVFYAIYEINNNFPLGFIGHSSYKLGMISMVWCAVWTYMIFKPDVVPSYKTINFSSTRTLSSIPWKSMCTSMPVLAIIVSCACEALDLSFPYLWTYISSKPETFFRYSTYKYINVALTYLTMIFTIAVLEFYPEVRFMSTINVRKFWSCAYFLSQGVFFYICSFTHETMIDDLFFIFFDIVEVLYAFGFIINHLDIAPRYASILCGIIIAINYISDCFVVIAFLTAKDYLKDEHTLLVGIQVAVVLVNLTALVFYYVFASAEIQPWAKTHEEESHQDSDTTAVLVN